MEQCHYPVIHKKGDKTRLQNYRLFSQLWKLFTKTISKRLRSKLDAYELRVQAGIRSGLETNDHLQIIQSLNESTVMNIINSYY